VSTNGPFSIVIVTIFSFFSNSALFWPTGEMLVCDKWDIAVDSEYCFTHSEKSVIFQNNILFSFSFLFFTFLSLGLFFRFCFLLFFSMDYSRSPVFSICSNTDRQLSSSFLGSIVDRAHRSQTASDRRNMYTHEIAHHLNVLSDKYYRIKYRCFFLKTSTCGVKFCTLCYLCSS
jgi:hypothetical protein